MTNTLYARPAAACFAFAATLLALAATRDASAGERAFRVLHHEPVQLRSSPGADASERVTFDAYGKRFALKLSPNERIRRAIGSGAANPEPFEGAVDGLPGSWVRITRSASGWRGMIFDGQELYAIEPAADIADVAVQPLDAAGSEPVVYRLSDALLPLDAMSCEVAQPEAQSTADQAFEQISHELQAQAAALATARQVQVGVVGDFEFYNQFGSESAARDAIVARMNIVDGIFMTQLGVKVSLAPPVLFRTPADPFSKSAASDLLKEVGAFRRSSATQRALGLTHLMTGRDLDGDTVGIAYIGTLCESSNAASLSEGRRSTTQSALIAAHEIGHNFNAPHDGEGACASTPQTFLMAPRLNGSDRFSACSVAQIQPMLSSARCLVDYEPPDVSLELASTSVQAVVDTAFTLSFTVRAVGGDTSNDVSVVAMLPASLTVQSASTNGGTCSPGTGSVTCDLGTLLKGEVRRVDLSLTPTQAGTAAVDLAVDSSNDANVDNDSGTIEVTATTEPLASPEPPATGGTSSTGGGGGGSGGGGGRVDVALLALLLGLSSVTLRVRVSGSRRKSV